MALTTKLALHIDQHQCCNLEPCPMVATKNEIKEFIKDCCLVTPFEAEIWAKLETMESGFAGRIMGVDVFFKGEE